MSSTLMGSGQDPLQRIDAESRFLIAGWVALCAIAVGVWLADFDRSDHGSLVRSARDVVVALPSTVKDLHPAFNAGVSDDPAGPEVTGSSIISDAAARPVVGTLYDVQVPPPALPSADPALGAAYCSQNGCWQTAGYVRELTAGTSCGEQRAWHAAGREGNELRMVCR